jgi:hypothetical protein
MPYITTKQCPQCGRHDTFEVTEEQLRAREAGAKVQNAFPHLNVGQREQLISGLCGPCFDRLFGEAPKEATTI